VGFLAILNAETAFIRAIVAVGINVPTTSGKDTGIINSSWNVKE
jgi:hypothetical protein